MKSYLKVCGLILLAIFEMWAFHVCLLAFGATSDIQPLLGVVGLMVAVLIGGVAVKFMFFGKAKEDEKVSSKPDAGGVGDSNDRVRSDNTTR